MPSLVNHLAHESECDDALLAIGALRRPQVAVLRFGHSLGRSGTRSERPADSLRLSDDAVHTLYRAGVGARLRPPRCSNSIWDKRVALGTGEWERVRVHPYFTERMLRQSPALAPLAQIAVQHRETSRWFWLSTRLDRQRDLAARADLGGRGCVSGDA
jgi:response regulator RpfG family c-di-GMP phosphodiesterase